MNNQLEKNLSSALSQMVPDDLYERIERELDTKQERNVTPMKKNSNQKSVSRKRPIRLLSAAVAACLVLAVGLWGGTYYQNNLVVDSVVDIDVNPSIELNTNRKDKVISAVPINEDAEAILDGMSLKNTDLNVAVNAIIGSMVQQGYLIPGEENSILVSVSNENAEKARTVRNLVLTDIDSSLNTNQVDAAVINQTVESTTEAEAFAKAHQITVGKAVLVLNLAAKDASLDAEELASMSLKELAALVQEKNINISDIVDYDADDSIWENLNDAMEEVDENTSNGNAAQTSGLITAAEAKEIALKEAGINADDATFVKAKQDYENGVAVYEVEFLSGGKEYEYDIDAATGAILKQEIEAEDKNDRNTNKSDNTKNTNNNDDANNTKNTNNNNDANSTKNTNNTNNADSTQAAEPKSDTAGAAAGADTNTNSGEGITKEQAQEIALKHAGLTADEVQKLEVEKDRENGTIVYEVEFEKDRTEYSYEISAEDGTILHNETEID